MTFNSNFMYKKKIFLPVAAVIVLAVVLAGYSLFPSAPKVSVSPPEINFGEIDPNGGVKEAEFTVSNVGGGELEIFVVSTSCGCTTASVDKKLLKKNEQAKLSVKFDPSMHIGDAAGELYHVVYIKTNDPKLEEAEVEIHAYINSQS